MNNIDKNLKILRQLPPELNKEQVEAIILKLPTLLPPKFHWLTNFHINHLIIMSTLSIISLSIWLLIGGAGGPQNADTSVLLNEDPISESREVLSEQDQSLMSNTSPLRVSEQRSVFAMEKLQPTAEALKASSPSLVWSGNREGFELEALETRSAPIFYDNLVSENQPTAAEVLSLPQNKISPVKRKVKRQRVKNKRKSHKERNRRMKQRVKQRNKRIKRKLKSKTKRNRLSSSSTGAAIKPQVEIRAVAKFESLEVGGLAVVYLSKGPTKNIEVDVKGMPISDLITKVEDGKLIITTRGEHSGEEIQVSVSAPSLKQITITGSGELISQDPIQAENLEVTVADVGAAWLKIDTKKIIINMNGGDLDLSGDTDNHAIVWNDPEERGTLTVHKLKSNNVTKGD